MLRRKRIKRGFTLVELLVVISIIGMLVSMLLPAVQQARESGRRTVCLNNIRQVQTAAIGYAEARKYYPGHTNSMTVTGVTGPICVSYLVPLLPGMERNDLYNQWTNNITNWATFKSNSSVAISNGSTTTGGVMYSSIFICPSSPAASQTIGSPLSYIINAGQVNKSNVAPASTLQQTYITKYAASTNPTTAERNAAMASGIAYDNSSAWPVNIRISPDFVSNGDGTAYTVLLSENLQADRWELPQNDWYLNGTTWTCTPTSLASSFVWFNGTPEPGARMNEDKTPATAPAMHIESSPTVLPTTKYYDPHQRPSSMHQGGSNFAWCGGNCKFVSDEIDYKVYKQLMTTNDVKSLNLDGQGTAPFLINDSSF